jgi:hypothetical protein
LEKAATIQLQHMELIAKQSNTTLAKRKLAQRNHKRYRSLAKFCRRLERHAAQLAIKISNQTQIASARPLAILKTNFHFILHSSHSDISTL